MKNYLLAAALLLGARTYAQSGEVEQLATQFFNAVKHNDTTAFTQSFINNKDLNRIMYHYVQQQDSLAKDSIKEIIMPEMEQQLAREFVVMKQQFRDSGVSWENARYINCWYNLLKDKSSVYPSLTGEILFESNGRRYAILIGSAIYINNAWKLVTFRLGHAAIPARNGVAYFLEKDGFFKSMLPGNISTPGKTKPPSPVKLSNTPLYKKPAAKLKKQD